MLNIPLDFHTRVYIWTQYIAHVISVQDKLPRMLEVGVQTIPPCCIEEPPASWGADLCGLPAACLGAAGWINVFVLKPIEHPMRPGLFLSWILVFPYRLGITNIFTLNFSLFFFLHISSGIFQVLHHLKNHLFFLHALLWFHICDCVGLSSLLTNEQT